MIGPIRNKIHLIALKIDGTLDKWKNRIGRDGNIFLNKEENFVHFCRMVVFQIEVYLVH